jgi:hypothetical protein
MARCFISWFIDFSCFTSFSHNIWNSDSSPANGFDVRLSLNRDKAIENADRFRGGSGICVKCTDFVVDLDVDVDVDVDVEGVELLADVTDMELAQRKCDAVGARVLV